ncbi:hypothetical protein EJ02DRAFT_438654 [Clathrospora elynae]|uniref:Uncharacterized protein n=1 Tax=Clathrospora elynae TaxID=706981 RepID=A0A6A5S6F9_9PLEO|nr:hypothetical protein EJ02DRAFT_438654 [Clathrospora elynae]
MATTTSTSTGSGIPTASLLNVQVTISSGFAGDGFSNNLFSDLAPTLALFGEQVTKQFLTMSMGWADHILLGMGPLGIIIAVVLAIRVGRARQLKALIGRARESRTSAEQELLSSTSDDIRELWNSAEVVRHFGQSMTKEVVLYKDNDGYQLGGLDHAVSNKWIVEDKAPGAQENPSPRIMWSLIATILSIAGFICQFVGLRRLHWSATVIQLGVTLIMTGIRS